MYFWGGQVMWLCSCIPMKEGGIKETADLTPSSQTVVSLFRTLFASQNNLTKIEFSEFTSMEKCTQLLLINTFGKIKKNDKISFYL